MTSMTDVGSKRTLTNSTARAGTASAAPPPSTVGMGVGVGVGGGGGGGGEGGGAWNCSGFSRDMEGISSGTVQVRCIVSYIVSWCPF